MPTPPTPTAPSTPAVPAVPADQDVRWLTPEERRAWLGVAGLASRLTAALDRDMTAHAQLSFFEYMVMAVLSEQPDRTLGMTEIADVSSSSLSRLSHAVKRLEGAGLVRRERCPGIGRRTNAVLTDAGHDKVLASAPHHVATVRHYLIDTLTADELAVLGQVGERVTARIVAGPPDPGGA